MATQPTRSSWGLTTPTGGDWRLSAACRNLPPQWWELGTGKISRDNQAALKICDRCPVAGACYKAAADETLPMPTTGVLMAGLVWPRRVRPWVGRVVVEDTGPAQEAGSRRVHATTREAAHG